MEQEERPRMGWPVFHHSDPTPAPLHAPNIIAVSHRDPLHLTACLVFIVWAIIDTAFKIYHFNDFISSNQSQVYLPDHD